MGMLQVFYFHIFALLDPRALYFLVTPYVLSISEPVQKP